MKILLLLALAAGGIAVLTGCGGSSRVMATGAAASTRPSGSSAASQLIARADAVCKRLNNEIAATPPGMQDSPLKLSRNALQHAALERKAVSDLSRLTPPASLAHDWAQILADTRRLAAELTTLGRYWKLDEKQRISALGASKKHIHTELSAIASHDGFKDCSHV